MRNATSSAAALYETLRDLGVRHHFSIDEPVALFAEMDRSVIRPITVRDERNGAIMADAYARVSGRPGVCGGCQGPGSTNMVHGLIEAWYASTPVVAMGSDFASLERGRNVSQGIDVLPFFRPITKLAIRVEDAERVSETTARAFFRAVSGRPGPVFLSYPNDVVDRSSRSVPVVDVQESRYPAAPVAPDPDAVHSAAAILAGAEKPVLVAGGGVLISRAEDELLALAERLQAPVATTPMGKGSLDEFHPLSAGTTGGYTGGAGGRGTVTNKVVREADVVLLIGSRTDEVATAGWTVPSAESTIIHLDIDPVEIGRNYSKSIPLVADARLGLRALMEALQQLPKRTVSWADDELRAGFSAWEESVAPLSASDAKPIHPLRVMAEMSSVLDDNTIVTTDASYCSAWAMEVLRLGRPGRRMLYPRGYASLGWGVPAAIGAQLAAPDKVVLCLSGDGGFGYVSHELETAARYGLPIVVIILNNHSFGYQKHYEQVAYDADIETDLLDVDHAALARALRCNGVRVTDPSDLAPALHDAIERKEPTLIDVVSDRDVMPAVKFFDHA